MKQPIALLTGATGGIGECLAGTLDELGYACAFVSRTEEKLQKLKDKLGGAHRIFCCDLSDLEAVGRLVQQVTDEMGGLDALINNAGVGGGGALHEADPGKIHDAFQVNVLAGIQLMRDAAPHLFKSPQAAIINIVSIAGQQVGKGSGAYAASKHAMLGASHSAFEDMRSKGVKVCAICPGMVATSMTADFDAKPEKMLQASDIAYAMKFALQFPRTGCPVEITLRPQLNPTL